jgi:predicted aldo/keto reductase-like oxidoreductase
MPGKPVFDLSRRDLFLAAGATAAAGFLLSSPASRALAADGETPAPAAAPAQVLVAPTRRMGRTNLQASVIAGNESMSDPALVDAAMDMGVNYWHKGGGYLAKALKKYGRDKQLVELCCDATGSADKDVERFKGQLGKELEYADFYKMHGSYNEHMLEAFGRLKEQGLARHLSASFHDHNDALRAIKTGNLDQVQIGASALGGESVAKVLAAAKEADCGVIFMKTMMGGEKDWGNEGLKKVIAPYTEMGFSTPQAIAAACLAMDGVTSLVVITNSVDRLRSLVEAAARTAGDRTASLSQGAPAARRFCAVCGACSGVCPWGVAIQDIMRAEMYAAGYGEMRRAKALYASIPKRPSDAPCADCGACAKACPFKVASPERISSAARMLA